MRYFNRLFLLAIVLPAISFAQSNFKPGYVVSLKGDTLQGAVNYREWGHNPTEIEFKQNNTVQKYTAANALAFGINGLDYYQRFIVAISTDAVSLEKLSTDIDTTKKTVSAFLHLVAKGKSFNLYNYTDELKPRLLLLENKTGILRELTYHIYYVSGQEAQSTATQYRFRDELRAFAYQYQKTDDRLLNLINRAQYNNYDIKTIVNLLNGESAANNTPSGGLKVKIFAGPALNVNNFQYHGGIPELVNNATSPATFGPQINLGIDIFLNSQVGRLVLRFETGYSTTELKTGTPSTSHSFRQNTFMLYPQVIYNIYNTDPLKFYLGAGVNMNLSSYSDRKLLVLNVTTAPITANPDIISLTTTWTAVPLRAGFLIAKKYELYGCYYFDSGITNSINYSGDISTIRMGINYHFGKQ
ncbi:MAG: hypothetical protein V4592_17355 [Bacteroidota bacterium]